MSDSLVEKYRPKQFKDIVGQSVVVNMLKKSIEKNNINVGYLFVGVKGVGKTSSARIFAKAINCLNRVDGVEPCGECENCRVDMDVVEVDAASNRGIDDLKKIRTNSQYNAFLAKKRIWIIDEAHQLSKDAWSVLLKTLEENKNSVFVFVTTSIDKIPQTIMDRVVVMNFKPISAKLIMERLQYICDKENIEIDSVILDRIVSVSDGSLRNSIKLLSEVMLLGDNVDSKVLNQILSKMEDNLSLDFVKAWYSLKIYEVNNVINKLIESQSVRVDEIVLNLFDKTVQGLVGDILKVESPVIVTIQDYDFLKVNFDYMLRLGRDYPYDYGLLRRFFYMFLIDRKFSRS
jgi:DNA polymerase-3 subunit gamma/tau